ncbi:hypothetical protein [Nitrobacter sp.]|uniref:hypothetical protein n=1 Tax=Nitrobacter sp. TaxID=29420 RepID=UPI003F650255
MSGQAGDQPDLTFNDLMADPMIRTIMEADGIDERELRELFDRTAAQRNQQLGEDSEGSEPVPDPHLQLTTCVADGRAAATRIRSKRTSKRRSSIVPSWSPTSTWQWPPHDLLIWLAVGEFLLVLPRGLRPAADESGLIYC